MIILKILLGILLFLIGIILLILFCKIRVEAEYNGRLYQIKIKFLGITLYREYTDKEIEKLLKKASKKAKNVAKEVVKEANKEQSQEEFLSRHTAEALPQKRPENQTVKSTKSVQTEPIKKPEEAEKKEAEQKAAWSEKKQSSEKESADTEDEDIFEEIRSIKRMIRFAKESLSKISKYFLRKIVVEHLKLELAVANEDRAVTAQLFGYINALVANMINYLARYMPVRKMRINIYPDFAGTSFSGFVEAGISFRGINGLLTALFLYLDYRKFVKKKPEEEEKNG